MAEGLGTVEHVPKKQWHKSLSLSFKENNISDFMNKKNKDNF